MARPALAGALAISLLACGDGAPGISEGSLRIHIVTTGVDLDPDGYHATLDQGEPLPVAVNDTLEVDRLAPGEHIVQLDGIRWNCLSVSPNPAGFTIEAGVSTVDSLEVECFARTGTIQIRTVTLGEGGPLDGYVVRVGTVSRAIPQTGQAAVALEPGIYEVLLDELTEACVVDGSNPQVATVAEETVPRVHFVVRCTEG